MDKRADLRAALAALAATAGTGFASGRELVIFFAQLGRASWVSVAASALSFGLIAGLLTSRAAVMNAGSLAGLCAALPGRTGRAARLMHCLLLALTAGVMLVGAGETGALTLPMRHGFWAGVALALALALVMNAARLRPLPWVGLATLLACLAFYGALALDPRPVRLHIRGDVALLLEGSVPAALLLGTAHGAMNACIAADVLSRRALRGARARRTGALCAALLCAVLACANAALTGAGRLLLGQALPTVVLAARWGLVGFWCCAGLRFVCAVSTLAAALGGMGRGTVRSGL